MFHVEYSTARLEICQSVESGICAYSSDPLRWLGQTWSNAGHVEPELWSLWRPLLGTAGFRSLRGPRRARPAARRAERDRGPQADAL